MCCGSDPHRSAFIWLSWIRIRIGNADPDPGAWKLNKIYKQIWVLPFQKGFCTFVGMFFDLLVITVPTYFRYLYFLCKDSAFCDLKD
jgi:hypothetical protein